jgi:hypothetical protein
MAQSIVICKENPAMSCCLFRFLAACLCLLTPSLVGAQALPTIRTVSLDVSAGDLHAVVRMLELQTGIRASVCDSETPFHSVYVHLDEVSVVKATRTIALSAGAKVIVNTDGSYLFEALDAVDPLPSVAPQAQMPTPRVPLNSADLHWYRLTLHHAVASDILNLMHWNRPNTVVYSFETFWPRSETRLAVVPEDAALPSGVNRIFAMARDTALLVEATKEGFSQVRQVVKILDIAAHGMTATVSYISVSENAAGLKWAASSRTSPVEIVSGPLAVQAWENQTRSGQTPITVKTLNEAESQKPLEWLVPGYRLTLPRLNSDDSLTLTLIPSSRLFLEQQTPPIHRGDVLAIKEFKKSGVMLVRVEY